MSIQENQSSIISDSAQNSMNPPLVEVTSQLSPDSAVPVATTNPTGKPQVVFVQQQRNTQIIEIHVQGKSNVDSGLQVESEIEPVTANVEGVTTAILEDEAEATAARFAVDPFVYEVDGSIPVMPKLPIVSTHTSTDEVVAREQSGDHFAWRLMPVPYPAEGNVSQVPADEFVQPSQPGPARRKLAPPKPTAVEPWADTEVVAENENSVHGDCFFAQSGDVIAIDGNQGFDHIDLRSYSIDDATFQPGSILLHSGFEVAEAGEGEELPEPITIKHRGVGFAIFKGEVRVEL